MKLFVRLTVALALVGSTGCTPDCQSLCEEWVEEDCCDKNDLECGDQDPEDCEFQCAQQERLAEKADCEEELDAWNECEADLDDICDSMGACSSTCDENGENCSTECEGECEDEIQDFQECTLEHCTENPDDVACY
jgi:hypothetical protein